MTQSPDHHHILGVTPEDKSMTHTLTIQFEIEPLPHGRFRGSEGIELGWQDMSPQVWANLIILAHYGMRVIVPLALNMTILQHVNGGGAIGEASAIKSSVTNDDETRELGGGHVFATEILGDPCVIEAIWAAAEEKHRCG